MPRKPRYLSISVPLRFLLLGCVLVQTTTSSTKAQQASNSTPQVGVKSRQVSLAHCYWHFLMYQNHLTLKAAAQVKNGEGLSGQLQATLGFSDGDLASIRSSSARLAVQVDALNKQAAVVAAMKTPTTDSQLQSLTAEREADIAAEISYLRNALGPVKTAAFEAFIVQMFSPKAVAVHLTPPSSKTAPSAVQP